MTDIDKRCDVCNEPLRGWYRCQICSADMCSACLSTHKRTRCGYSAI